MLILNEKNGKNFLITLGKKAKLPKLQTIPLGMHKSLPWFAFRRYYSRQCLCHAAGGFCVFQAFRFQRKERTHSHACLNFVWNVRAPVCMCVSCYPMLRESSVLWLEPMVAMWTNHKVGRQQVCSCLIIFITESIDLMLFSCKCGAPCMLFSQAKRRRDPPFTSLTNP